MPSAHATVGTVVVVIVCPCGMAVAASRRSDDNDVCKKGAVHGCRKRTYETFPAHACPHRYPRWRGIAGAWAAAACGMRGRYVCENPRHGKDALRDQRKLA